jgi:primosomal protein N' (replication factor Y)
MNYYRVAVTGSRVIVDRHLAYESSVVLAIGQVIRVPLKNRAVTAIVIGKINPPDYATKPIKAIIGGAVVPKTQIQLAQKLADYYAAPLSSAYSLLIPRGIYTKRRMPLKRASPIGRSAIKMPALSDDQSQAIATITRLPSDRTILLRGETASGKTRIYRELIAGVQKAGKGALLLVPEIGLTATVVQQFQGLSDDIFVVHSTLTDRERHILWLKILQHANPIVIGPRSALFYPLNNLGIIIIDESHDGSYKQTNLPKYHALRVARMLSEISHCKLLLASATPCVEDYYYAQKLTSPIIEISRPVRALKARTRKVHIVNMTTARLEKNYLSKRLIDSISESLSNGKQTLLFHNRRGTSSSVVCAKCGFVSHCPQCRRVLTHHLDTAKLLCHICGYSSRVAVDCPHCGQSDLIYRGFGTKRLESDLRELFPGARIARFDSDNKGVEKLVNRYDELRSGDVDIIIGTQIVAKGLDLPNLETVCIPLIESLLYLPDYVASERFFQLVYQSIGRTGRHIDGHVIIQTYDISNPILGLVLQRDYQRFYQSEIANRRTFHYPPFCFLLLLTIEKSNTISARNNAQELADSLSERYRSCTVLGPAPAYFEQSRKGYRWQLLIKSNARKNLVEIVRSLPGGWQAELDPISLL